MWTCLTAVVLILPSVKIAPMQAGTAGRANEEAGPRAAASPAGNHCSSFVPRVDLTVASPGAEGLSRGAWVPAGVHPLPHGTPHPCSCWDPRPASLFLLSPARESHPSPALLAERPPSSLTTCALAPGLLQRRGLHTACRACGPAGSMRLLLPCLCVSAGRGLQT